MNYKNDVEAIDAFVVKYKELNAEIGKVIVGQNDTCLLYTSPSPRDRTRSRMPSSA